MAPFLPFPSLVLRVSETDLGTGSKLAGGPAAPETGRPGAGFAFLDEIDQKHSTTKAATQLSETGAQLLGTDGGVVENTEPDEGTLVKNLEDEVLLAGIQQAGTPTTQSPETDADGMTVIPMEIAFTLENPATPAVVVPKDGQGSDVPEPFRLAAKNIDAIFNGKSDSVLATQSTTETRLIAPSVQTPPSLIPTADGSEISETPRDQVGRQDGSALKNMLPALPTTGRPSLENTQVFGTALETATPTGAYLSEAKPSPGIQATIRSSFEPGTGLAQLALGQPPQSETPSASLSAIIPKSVSSPEIEKAAFFGDAIEPDFASSTALRPSQMAPPSVPDGAQDSKDEPEGIVGLARTPSSSREFAPNPSTGSDMTGQLRSEAPTKGKVALDVTTLAPINTGPADRDLGEAGQSDRREIASSDTNNVLETRPRFDARAETTSASRNAIVIPQSPGQPTPERLLQREPTLKGVQATGAPAQPEQLRTPAMQVFGDLKVQVREWPAEAALAREARQPMAVTDATKFTSLTLSSEIAPSAGKPETQSKMLPMAEPMAEAVPQPTRSPHTQPSAPMATAPAQTIAAAPAFLAGTAVGGAAILTTSKAEQIKETKTESIPEGTQVNTTSASGTPPAQTVLPVVGGPPPLNQPTPLSQAEPDAEELLLAGTQERAGTLASERTSSTPVMQTADGKLSQSIAAQLRGQLPQLQGQTTEILLDPEELGRVRMTLTGQDGSGIVVLQIERPETLDLIRRNLDQMRAELADAGWQSVDFSFGQDLSGQNGEGSPSEDGAAASGRDGATNLEAGNDSAAGPPASRISQKSGLDLRL